MNIKKNLLLVIVLLNFLIINCAVHTELEPIGCKKIAAHASLGGPIIRAFGLNIPAPYLTAGATYGFRDDLNLSCDFNFLSVAYSVVGLDPAITWFPFTGHNCKTIFGLQAKALYFASLKAKIPGRDRMRLYPVVTPTAAWPLGAGRLYAGSNFIVPLTRPDYDQSAAYFIISPLIGYRWDMNGKMRLLFEFKYHGVNIPSKPLAVTYSNNDYSGVNYGAPSLLVGFEWSLR